MTSEIVDTLKTTSTIVTDASRVIGSGVKVSKAKAAIFRAIRTGDSDVSAARVRPISELIWPVYRAAAGKG